MDQAAAFLQQGHAFLVSSPIALCAVTGIALLSISCTVLSLLRGLRFLTYSSGNIKRYGKWAVVTGATDGIGLGYAREFARQGLNVLLVSRTEERLKATAEELNTKYGSRGAQIDYVAADLSSPDPAVFAKVQDKLREIEVGILVNNAGMSYDHAEYLTDITDEHIAKLIQLNVIALTRITKAVLPGMVSRRKGLVINVGSGAGTMPTGDPLYAVYSGSKAYVDAFSRSLYYELRDKGVHVECSVPFFVSSKMSKIRRPTLMAPSADAFARTAIARSGRLPSIVPYTAHAIQDWAARRLPEWLLAKYLLSHHHSVRRRALKKKEKAQ